MSDNLARSSSSIGRTCRPFVKWAGGKGQLLTELRSRVPATFGSYFEPFAGAGALFFSLQPQIAYLADVNEELINAYMVVQQDVEHLIELLADYSYDRDRYYAVRALDRNSAFDNLSPAARAARFIYLNKTCFNGLYRVNSRGEFNVPFGRYVNPTICDSDNLRACSATLQDVTLAVKGFAASCAQASRGDFVYLDPPYMPLSRTSSFTRYAKDDFTASDQERLRDTCRALNKAGVFFMLSNSAAPLMYELYREFAIEEVAASRAINSKAAKRGAVSELIVRNY